LKANPRQSSATVSRSPLARSSRLIRAGSLDRHPVGAIRVPDDHGHVVGFVEQ
jgi:hypothetical protein